MPILVLKFKFFLYNAKTAGCGKLILGHNMDAFFLWIFGNVLSLWDCRGSSVES